MSDWDFLWDLEGQEYLDAMATGMTYYDSWYIEQQDRKSFPNPERNKQQKPMKNNYDLAIEKFQKLHSEIIEYFQCIEYDMKRIYSAMSSDDFDENMDWLANNNWGVVLNKLKKLDNSDDDPFFNDDEYSLLDEIRDRRNYWCHQCYLDWVYCHDSWERNIKLQKVYNRLANENNIVSKLQKCLPR